MICGYGTIDSIAAGELEDAFVNLIDLEQVLVAFESCFAGV